LDRDVFFGKILSLLKRPFFVNIIENIFPANISIEISGEEVCLI